MESPKKSLASFIVCSWTICLDSWIPRLSLSSASLVCLSVTLSPFRTLRCNPTAAPVRTLKPCGPRSDDAGADHLTLVVAYLFDDRARLVFSPAHHPALVVKVLLLDRQVGGAPDHVLVGDLTALVEGRLDDVPGIVDRALHRLARVVGSLAEQTFDLLRPSGPISSLTCRILCLVHGVVRLLGRLPRSVGRSLRGLAGRIRGALGDLSCSLTSRVSRPFCNLTHLFGGLAGGIADALGGLACGLTRILRRLTAALAHFAGCLACTLTDFTCRLAGAFPHFTHSLPSAFSDLADGLACATANVLYGFSRALDGFTGAFANIFHGLAGALDGFSGAFANIFHGGACSFADVFDCGAGTRADILNGGSCTRSHVFDRGTRAGANVLYSRAGAFADVLDGGSCTRSDICHGLIGTFSDELSRSFSDILYGRAHTLAHELTRALAHVFDRGAGAFADVFYRRAHAFGQLLDDLGVAVYGRENPVEDGGQVVQPGFQERLRFYPLYDQLDPAQVHVGPDGELDQVEHLGVH